MAQFRFPLDKVLRWRAIELTREESKLQVLIEEKARLEAMLARVAHERSALTGSVSSLPALRGDDLRALAAYGLRLRRHFEKLNEARGRAQRNLAAQQKKYAEAKTRVRLLEELKSRRFERWRYEEGRELESLATESYLTGWNRDEP